MNICTIAECGKPVKGKGLCNKHYQNFYRCGDPLGLQLSPLQRFWMKVDKTEECWNWTGAKSSGYGHFRDERQGSVLAHRWIYEQLVDPHLGDDEQIDHQCHNPACVNPRHLRSVTNKQNGENRSGPTRLNSSGVRGVRFDRGKWLARVGHNGSSIYVGRFDTIEAAEAAVIKARNKVFSLPTISRRSNTNGRLQCELQRKA